MGIAWPYRLPRQARQCPGTHRESPKLLCTNAIPVPCQPPEQAPRPPLPRSPVPPWPLSRSFCKGGRARRTKVRSPICVPKDCIERYVPLSGTYKGHVRTRDRYVPQVSKYLERRIFPGKMDDASTERANLCGDGTSSQPSGLLEVGETARPQFSMLITSTSRSLARLPPPPTYSLLPLLPNPTYNLRTYQTLPNTKFTTLNKEVVVTVSRRTTILATSLPDELLLTIPERILADGRLPCCPQSKRYNASWPRSQLWLCCAVQRAPLQIELNFQRPVDL